MTISATLVYVHDPMCSWCWGFAPTFRQLREQLPPTVGVERLLGGLAADSDQPMTTEMREYLQSTWHRITERIPGTSFNFAFWRDCEPRRGTWPACRAVIAARRLDRRTEEPMISAIQQAYYLQARNPSNTDTLIELATEIGLDADHFADLLEGEDTHRELAREMARARSMGADSFPSLRLHCGTGTWPVHVDYGSVEPMLDTVTALLATG
jgi:putative protein-disulfide isomerase